MNQPKQPVLIFDGHCVFCTKQIASLKRLAGEGVLYESFQDPNVLAKFPGLSYEECMKEIKLVTEKGRILGGAHAVFYALSLPPLLRPLRWIYLFPILKQVIDFTYRFIARNRYKIQSRECPAGTCPLHGGPH
jgi:predicted DCC family thiol-disulfide oxidoreductase YuxK